MTIIEVIVAAAVFAIAALFVMHSLGKSTVLDAHTWETHTAILAGQSKLEEITAAGYANAASYGVSPKNSFAVSGLAPQTTGLQPGSVEVTKITSTSSSLYDVTVRIRWTGVQGDREEVLKTMVAEKP